MYIQNICVFKSMAALFLHVPSVCVCAYIALHTCVSGSVLKDAGGGVGGALEMRM